MIAVLKLASGVSEVSSTKELLDNGAVFSSDNEELLAQFFQAENLRDWDTYETFLAKDVVWELREAGQTKIIKGKCADMNCSRSAYRGSNATFSCEGLYTGDDNSCLAAMLVSDAGTRSCDMFWFEDGKIVFELEVILG